MLLERPRHVIGAGSCEPALAFRAAPMLMQAGGLEIPTPRTVPQLELGRSVVCTVEQTGGWGYAAG